MFLINDLSQKESVHNIQYKCQYLQLLLEIFFDMVYI